MSFEDAYLAQAGIEMETLETPLLDDLGARAWKFFGSLWSGNNAEPVSVLEAPAMEMVESRIHELPGSTARLLQAAPVEVSSYVPPSPLGEGVHPVATATVESTSLPDIVAEGGTLEYQSISLAPLTEIESQMQWGTSQLDRPDWSRVAPFETNAGDFLDAPMEAPQPEVGLLSDQLEENWIVTQGTREAEQVMEMQRVPLTGLTFSGEEIEMGPGRGRAGDTCT